MTESIIVALITGVLAFAGTFVSSNKAMAVMQTKIEALTEEVREHNNFARRLPVVEEQINGINKRIDVIERKNAS